MKVATQASLQERIAARIEREGPMTFAAYMEAALYDEPDGFYARSAPGEHFVTSAHLSPAFAALLTRWLAGAWDALGAPDPFTVVDLGAGDGSLAAGIRRAAAGAPGLRSALRLVCVDRASAPLAALRRLGLDARASFDGMRPFRGCIIANELLDNVPFHRLRRRGGRLVEAVVGAEGGRLVEREAEPAPEALAALRGDVAEGTERIASPAALALVRDACRLVAPGYALFVDYTAPDGDPAVRTYARHRLAGDALDAPGSRDVTGAVDLGAAAAEAQRCGMSTWGPAMQRDLLAALGMGAWMDGVRRAGARALTAGDGRAAARAFAARSAATLLVDPDHLGSLRALAVGSRGLPAPPGFGA